MWWKKSEKSWNFEGTKPGRSVKWKAYLFRCIPSTGGWTQEEDVLTHYSRTVTACKRETAHVLPASPVPWCRRSSDDPHRVLYVTPVKHIADEITCSGYGKQLLQKLSFAIFTGYRTSFTASSPRAPEKEQRRVRAAGVGPTSSTN
jgi:hypothetical protein